MFVLVPPIQAKTKEYEFNIPAEQMDVALGLFAQQSETPLLFSHDQVQRMRANVLMGRYSVEEALDILLKDTGITGHINEQGVLTIMLVDSQQNKEEKEMQNKPTRLTPLAAALAAIFGGSSGSAVAQDDLIREEVIVTGIRGSVQESLSIKRQAAGFVDAISSEDIGKLPDQNIAEALQRVTGVSIERNRGEGDLVSIRGLAREFVRTSLNGRTLTSASETRNNTLSGGRERSTGREVNFDVLPAEIVSALEVIKSPSAEHVEGGIGGVVNIKTARPLDVGNKLAGNLEGTYRDFGGDADPSASGLWSWANDSGTFGALVSLSYSERSIRNDRDEAWGHAGSGVNFDTDGDGVGDNDNVFINLASLFNNFEEDRERGTFAGTLQWNFNDTTELTLDALYSKRSVDSFESQAIVLTGSAAGLPDVLRDASGITVNPDDSIQDPNLVLVQAGNQGRTYATRYTAAFGGLNINASNQQNKEDEVLALGLNFKSELGAWTYSADLSYSDASGELFIPSGTLNQNGTTTASFPGIFDTTGGRAEYTIQQGLIDGQPGTFSEYVSNPANFVVAGTGRQERFNDDEELAFKFDVQRQLESGIFSDVKFGFRYRNREKDINRFINTNTALNAAIPAEELITVSGTSGFADGDFGGPNFSDFLFFDLPSTQAEYFRRFGPIQLELNTTDSYSVEEETLAAYFQLDLESSIGNVPYIGNIGVRVIRTQQDIVGFSRPFELQLTGVGDNRAIVFTSPDTQEIPFDDDYVSVLPSLNLRFELNEDLFLRAAISKTLTRPTFENLAPALNIEPTQVRADAGNPSLEPYESINYDLGVEWYFAEASALYASVFYKDIDDFIATTVNQNVTLQGVTFTTVTQPDNVGQGEIQGLELGYQHAFDNGLGYILNYTVTDSEVTVQGVELPIPNVPDVGYNATLYYDKGPFEARLAYSYRDSSLLVTNDFAGNAQFLDDYGQLDFSFSYDVSDYFQVYLEAINLTDEIEIFNTEDNSALPTSRSIVGPRYSFGIRGIF